MRKEDLISVSWILFFYIYMYAVSLFVPKEWRAIAGFGGLILIFGVMFLQQMILTMMYAKYKLLKVWIFPERREERLLIESINWFEYMDAKGHKQYMNEVILAKPIKHEEYGKVQKIYILTHDKPLPDLLDFLPKENALEIAGTVLDHPSVGYAILEEPHVPFEDHGQPYPIYDLTYSDKMGYIFEKEDEEEKADDPDVLKKIIRNLKTQIEILRGQVSKYRQQIIRYEEELMAIRDELKGLLASRIDIMNRVREMLLHYAEHYGGFWASAMNMQKRRIPINWSAIVTLAIVIGVFAYVYTHSEIIVFMLEHPLQTAIVLGIIGVIAYYIYKAKTKPKVK